MLVGMQRRLLSKNLKGSAKKWMDRHVNDQFVKQAKLQAYRSRAAFKLIEINQKFQLFKPGMRVIDVGCAPGGWSQIIAEQVQSQIGKETVVGADLLEIEPIDGVKFVHGDIEKNEIQEKISELLDFQKADVVCSDAVPDFVGERFIDHIRAVELNYMILRFCNKNLRKGGTLLMKIIQGPSEKNLYDDTKLFFDKLQRVKPSASRQESKEIYFLAQGYEQSKEPLAQELREESRKIENMKSEKEAEEYVQNMVKVGQGIVQEFVDEAMRHGQDLPEEFMEKIKNSEFGKGIKIEDKMSLREKQKARQRADEEEERLMFEQTGIRDRSKEHNMENLIKRYNRDMERYEKKLAKMKELDKKGIQYELEDIIVTEDEEDEDSKYAARMKEDQKKAEQQYEDEPYKAQEEELKNPEVQYENIKSKIQAMSDKAEGIKPPKTQSEFYEQYKQILEEMDSYHDSAMRDDAREQDKQLIRDEMKEFERMYKQEKTVKDGFYEKRSQKDKLRKTGGAKSDSPIWNDDD